MGTFISSGAYGDVCKGIFRGTQVAVKQLPHEISCDAVRPASCKTSRTTVPQRDGGFLHGGFAFGLLENGSFGPSASYHGGPVTI